MGFKKVKLFQQKYTPLFVKITVWQYPYNSRFIFKAKNLTMYWTVIFLICLFCITLVKYHISRIPQYKVAMKLPGPKALPILGNALEFFCKNEELLSRFIYHVEKYPKPMRFWMGQKLLLVFSTPDDIEQILSSSKMNYKDDLYRFMKPFLGNGLISGSGK